MNKIIFHIPLFLLLIFCNSLLFPQILRDHQKFNFCPLQVGNTWTYYYILCDPFGNCEASSFENSIVGDKVTNNKLYYTFENVSRSGKLNYYCRIDSLNGNVYRVYENNLESEYRVDSLFASTGDSFQVIDYPSDTLFMEVISLRDTVINGVQRTIREISASTHKIISVSGIGLFRINYSFNSTTNLSAACINGQYYDFLTGLEYPLSSFEFSLNQNYPNPFNPTTTIEYTLPAVGTGHDLSSQSTRLVIFDILGREVATLVNEQQRPGKYSVEFDTSGLASGIYYYRLQAGRYSETFKMVLLR